MNLLLCNGFNYYNRIIKKFDSYTDYYQFMEENAPIIENINFNPRNGIDTTQIVNWNNKTPDYVVCVNSNNEIDSRWFVIVAERTRAGQLNLTLHRDVIADNYQAIIDSPVYVEKATIRDINDVAIYNSEDISLNQIKTSETLIKDRTNVGWIYAYIDPSINVDKTVNVIVPPVQDYTVSNISSQYWYYYATNNVNYKQRNFNDTIQVGSSYYDTQQRMYKNYKISNQNINQTSTGANQYYQFKSLYDSSNYYIKTKLIQIKENIISSLITEQSLRYETNNISILNNKIFKDTTTNKFYRLTVTPVGSVVDSYNLTNGLTTTSTLVSSLTSAAEGVSYDSTKINANLVQIGSSQFKVTMQEIVSINGSCSIPQTLKTCKDNPYKILCFSFGKYQEESGTFGLTEEQAKSFATNLKTQLGDFCYDIQLLPYFALQNLIGQSGVGQYYIKTPTGTYGTDYTTITSNETPISICYMCDYSNFSFNINHTISLPNNILDRKLLNQCNMYRLCSPNYASVFEFNLLKTGKIDYFNVDITLKPISPYIHINSNFSNLYGSDYNDCRGLICGGDFSLPYVNDNWVTYQNNNKNYLNAFNREISTIELQNKWSFASDVSGAITGTLTGAAAGTIAGSGIAGGVASAIGGTLDVFKNETLRRDALDLKKDQFNYSIENIQAQPHTLARISSFDYNNKIFPILETYSCTDQEKEIFKDKLLYNGMKIMRIDRIGNFIVSNEKTYIKGKLIRLEGLGDDYNMINVIANELDQGVYL